MKKIVTVLDLQPKLGSKLNYLTCSQTLFPGENMKLYKFGTILSSPLKIIKPPKITLN